MRMFALLENHAVAICWLKQVEVEPESKGGVTVPTRNPVQISYYRIKRAIQVDHKWRGTALRQNRTHFPTMGSHRNGFNKDSYILSVDVGTTSIRCHVYDKEAKIRGSCSTKVFICSAFLIPHINHPLGKLNAASTQTWSFPRLCSSIQR